MSTDVIGSLEEAHDAYLAILAAVGSWAAPTPCDLLDVRALVDHVVLGDQLFAEALQGRAASREDLADSRRLAAVHADPLEAAASAARELRRAASVPGAIEGTVTVPVGVIPAPVAIQLRIVEALVHGWDLARATGQQTRFSDALVEPTIAFTRDALRIVPADRSPFGTPVDVAADAPALDRLVGLLGRDPGWQPPTHEH